ncbi:MAG: YSIRK-type signal peptide-containing protein [Ligilactobacillus animalis]|uniref:mucin-binding protein n=1 Tax=Ligilactobacillus animalis TaxID=1605 RepID=UPI0024317530|nr:YSIRK-type signal peptide-containing protein [Ligilactobacillus animalis]MCI5942245.1 YSIRK-type signal peptide-containing protein [Ligilactobacillus animalis]MDY2992777.1 YSIRK-type signal peptide-containing protein [Ligilactobacillus animalis]
MLSRNNNKLLIHKLEPKKQRFAIRKISVGVASVLIGFTFAGFSGVSADEATTTTKDHLKTEATAESASVPTKEVELTTSDETQAKEAEQTSSAETPAKETETTPVADDKAQVAEDTKAQAPAQAVTAEETSEPTTSTEKQTVAPADENEASETQTFNVEKQAEPQANVDLTDSKVAYAAAPIQAQDQQEEGFSVTDPDYSKYTYKGTKQENNLQTLIKKLGIDYKNSEYVFQWISSVDGEIGIVFTVDRGRDANGNVILTNEGKFNAYEYYMQRKRYLMGYDFYGDPVYVYGKKEQQFKKKVIIDPNDEYFSKNELHLGNVINDESKNAIAVDHFYAKGGTRYTPVFVGGHSGIESNTGDGYTTLSIYTPQVVEQKAKIDNGKVYKTQTGLTGQSYTTGVPKSAKVEEGKFLYAENSEGTMSEFHKGVVLVNNYHDGVTVRYTELDDQGTMQYEFLNNRGFAKKLYNESTGRNESGGILHVGQSFTYEGDSAKYHISNPYVQQTTDITYEYRKLGSIELYDENGNYLGEKQYVNDANDAAKASLPKVREKFTQGDIKYTLVAKEDLPSDLSRSIKYIYRGIETKVTHDTYTLTTKFVDEDGNELKAAEPQTITWTTTTKRDIHTNEIISQTSVPSAASYMAVNSPVIAGYYATTPGLGSRKAEQKNATQEIVYHKLGSIIAKDSQDNVLTTVPYENDANDATKIKEIVAPTIEGYHVKSEVVQPSDPGQNTVLNYGRDTQVAQIKYWDETAHKYITDDQGNDLETNETGAHNTKISHKKVAEQIHALKAKGYEYDFANQEFSTVYFDDDDSKTQTFTVKLMHGTTTKPESKQITREIIIHHPNQQEEPKKQTATLTRNVTRDKVTGDVIETGEWNPGNFDEVEVTPHKGYKIDETPAEIQNGKVVGKIVKADEEDGKKIEVKYIPLEQHALVKYVDDSTGTLLYKEDIQGVTDAAIEHSNAEKIAAYQANGYELVSDELADEKDPHFNAEDEPQVFEVHLKHRVEKVTNEAELEKTVTRTIIAEVPNGKHEETQTVKFTRTGAKDLVTGKTTWSDWSLAQEFDAYTAPVVPGYTPSKATVERATVTADDKDTTITITYTANDQKVMIKYVDVDDNNKEVKSQSLDGVTDQTVDVNYEAPANYELVAGQNLPGKVTFKANGNEPIIVKVQHKKVSVKVGEKGTQNVVTRKITVHMPDGTTKDASQTATFTRTGTKDLVTGTPTWNAWSPAQEFAAYTAPKVDGYTADKSAEQLTVNANDKIAPVDIYYTANDQKVMIKYVDVDDNNKEVKSQSLDGVTDQTVDVNYEAPTNYELVAGQDLPGKVTFKANGNEPIIVKVQHKKVSVEVGEQDTQNVVTRKITVHKPDGTTNDISQTAIFTRTGTKDLVTDKIAWNAWSPAQKLDAYTAPKVDGYTADKSAEKLTVNANDKIAPVDIYYTANDQKVMIKYIDVDENNKEVASQSVSGKTDQTVDTKYEVPANYELVAGQDLPDKVTFKAKGNEPIIVKVQHKHQDVTDEYKNDARKQDKVDHTIKRIITIEHPHATDETTIQNLHFTRQVTRDMATGHDTFGEWIPENADFFEEFAVPTLASDKGYTPEKTKVDRLEHITGDTDNQHVTVKFTANTQKAHVHYIDDTTGEKLEVVHVTGKTDEPIKHDSKAKVQDYLNKGYELVSDDFAKAGKPSYNAEDEDQHFEVHLKHALKDVTDQHAEHEVKHTVNRHIIIKHPHAADETHTQSIHFTRQVTRDMATGHDTFGEWIPESADFFEEFAVPTLASDKGYTPKKTKVDRLEHITGNTRDQREIVEFTANDQKAHVHYIDDTTGEKLEVVHVTGKTDEPIKHDSKAKVQAYLDKGYELVSDGFAKAGKPSYNAEDEDQHFEVHLKHAIKDVTDQHAEHEVKHTVNRHIIIKHPHAGDETHTQSIHFTRQVTRDMTTGQDTFGEWIPENADFFEEFAVPTLASDKGYTPKKTKVDRLEHITGDTGDKREIFEFAANDQKAHVHYIDDTTGKKLEVVHVTGKTDEPIKHDSKAKVQGYLDKGYELVSDGFAKAGKPSYNAEDEEQHFEVHLKHGQKDVTDEYKQDDKRKDHVDRTIKREVIINHPKEDPESYVQTAHFTRNVTRDTVTGEDKPGEWIPEENDFFEEVPVSLKDSDKGYTPAKTKVDRLENISADTPNQKEVVEFTPNEQHALVKYVDDSTGTLLDEEDIQGVTDAAIEHTNDEKIAAYQAKGYELVSDELADENDPHFNAEDEAQVYTVHLKHGSKVVKADPSNADSQKEVKRTIIVNAPDGTKTTKVQTVVFTRDGSKDLVTGKISYPDWNEIATKAFSQDDVPQYLGYTSMVAGRKQTTIAAQNVRPTDADQVIEVSYVARPSQQVITYQDENGNQIGTQVITGHTDETVKLVPVLPDGWELLDPDSLPENVTFAPEENPVLVITVKQTVTENSAKTEKDVENTEVAKQEVVNDTTDVTTDEKNEATLPQMGESDSETLAFSLLGLVTAAFSLFYFGKERRKTDN